MEIAKSRSTLDERPCDPEEPVDSAPEEELDEDGVPAPDVVPVLLLVCDVEEVVDEVFEESRTSKLNHIQLISSPFPKRRRTTYMNISTTA